MSDLKLSSSTKVKFNFILSKLPPVTDILIAHFMEKLMKLISSTTNHSLLAHNCYNHVFYTSCILLFKHVFTKT